MTGPSCSRRCWRPFLPMVSQDAAPAELKDAVAGGRRAEKACVLRAADLGPIYEHFCAELELPVDAAKLAAMKAKNAARLEELEAKIKDAEENFGETEVRDALHAKADYLGDIGDKEAAFKAYDATEQKTAGSANKMDLVFSKIRCDMGKGRAACCHDTQQQQQPPASS